MDRVGGSPALARRPPAGPGAAAAALAARGGGGGGGAASAAAAGGGGGGGSGGGGGGPRDPTALAIARIQKEREARRRSAEHFRRERDEEAARNEQAGAVGDVDFMRMIRTFRDEHAAEARKHDMPGDHSICVVVRKRPISKREIAAHDYDAVSDALTFLALRLLLPQASLRCVDYATASMPHGHLVLGSVFLPPCACPLHHVRAQVTCFNPRVVVHAPKLKVDGITKYLENTQFEFDHAFDEDTTTEEVYKYTVMPLVAYAFQQRGRGTCFAYGQTGSGKTYTMSGVQALAARDIFRALNSKEFRGRGFSVALSFFEIYGGRCSDLLHGRNKVLIREDGKQRVVAQGLKEVACPDMDTMLETIARGNAERTTHSTEVNQVRCKAAF